MTDDHRAQAIAEWRAARTGYDDTPDEAIARLSSVQARTLRLALEALGRQILDLFRGWGRRA